MRIAAFTVVLALACGVVFGLTTALHRPDGLLVNARSTLSRRHVRLRRVLVMGQIAASVVLLAGAALPAQRWSQLPGVLQFIFRLGLGSGRGFRIADDVTAYAVNERGFQQVECVAHQNGEMIGALP